MNKLRRGKVGGGLRTEWGVAHRSGAGELISVQRNRGRWWLYFFGNWDRKRTNYCEKNRCNHVPHNFREGELSLSTLLFTLKLKVRGELSGL